MDASGKSMSSQLSSEDGDGPEESLAEIRERMKSQTPPENAQHSRRYDNLSDSEGDYDDGKAQQGGHGQRFGLGSQLHDDYDDGRDEDERGSGPPLLPSPPRPRFGVGDDNDYQHHGIEADNDEDTHSYNHMREHGHDRDWDDHNNNRSHDGSDIGAGDYDSRHEELSRRLQQAGGSYKDIDAILQQIDSEAQQIQSRLTIDSNSPADNSHFGQGQEHHHDAETSENSYSQVEFALPSAAQSLRYVRWQERMQEEEGAPAHGDQQQMSHYDNERYSMTQHHDDTHVDDDDDHHHHHHHEDGHTPPRAPTTTVNLTHADETDDHYSDSSLRLSKGKVNVTYSPKSATSPAEVKLARAAQQLPPESRAQLWEIVEQIHRYLTSDAKSSAQKSLMKDDATRLERLLKLHRASTERERVLKMTHLALLMERRFYLEKLRTIEQYGAEQGWEDEGGLLKMCAEAVYFDDTEFTLVDSVRHQ